MNHSCFPRSLALQEYLALSDGFPLVAIYSHQWICLVIAGLSKAIGRGRPSEFLVRTIRASTYCHLVFSKKKGGFGGFSRPPRLRDYCEGAGLCTAWSVA